MASIRRRVRAALRTPLAALAIMLAGCGRASSTSGAQATAASSAPAATSSASIVANASASAPPSTSANALIASASVSAAPTSNVPPRTTVGRWLADQGSDQPTPTICEGWLKEEFQPLPHAFLPDFLVRKPPQPRTIFGWIHLGGSWRELLMCAPAVAWSPSAGNTDAQVFKRLGRFPLGRPTAKVAFWEVWEGSMGSVPQPSALVLTDAAHEMVAFHYHVEVREQAREVKFVPGRTVLHVRAPDDASGCPELWTLFDVTDGTFREIASANMGSGYDEFTPAGSLLITNGPPLQIRIRELPGWRCRTGGGAREQPGIERVIEWDPATISFVEKSRKNVTLVPPPGPRHSAIP